MFCLSATKLFHIFLSIFSQGNLLLYKSLALLAPSALVKSTFTLAHHKAKITADHWPQMDSCSCAIRLNVRARQARHCALLCPQCSLPNYLTLFAFYSPPPKLKRQIITLVAFLLGHYSHVITFGRLAATVVLSLPHGANQPIQSGGSIQLD